MEHTMTTNITLNNLHYTLTDAEPTNRAMYEFTASGTDSNGNDVRVTWDFSDLPGVDDIDDAGMYPWDDATYITVDTQ
jgi:hypothetical protein